MKKIILMSAMASAVLMAGGDITPVEPMVEVPVVVEVVSDDSGFYIGGGYGYGDVSSDASQLLSGGTLAHTEDYNYNSVMVDAGYKFNNYIAVEGRYWFGLNEDVVVTNGTNRYDFEASVDTFGIYVKPMYPVTSSINVYGLLGYASSDFDFTSSAITYNPSVDYDGFSWGLGADYSITDNVSVFADYVSMYDDESETSGITFDEKIYTFNFGLNYKF